ncbi:hypothetical protein C7448_10732 [Tenacibaculum gallaicum]|uniref:Lipoprotein n=1 Tax=Tenacibaculum gallaicum TaxID=561505 RepID=A0A3E0HJ95_9FLAO|nr:hypothetical protein [Tenacibaculum gallaicum]REH46472.1 hypothetical protein C7448_10732 [Tenacibaculum gallaicum]
MKKLLLVCSLIVLFSCNKENEGEVVNLQNEAAINKVKKLDLDTKYKNLLNPEFTTDEEYKEVTKSWGDFHKQVGKILKDNDFDWGIKDSSVKILNKIYFNKDGEVNYMVFKVMNENVTSSKKREYEQLLTENITKLKIDLTRKEKFAQCGNVKYLNK